MPQPSTFDVSSSSNVDVMVVCKTDAGLHDEIAQSIFRKKRKSL